MATYLIAWNPKRWYWEDIAEMADAVQRGRAVTIDWSCGRSKRIRAGDRAFFIRLRVQPKGIFASGTFITGAHPRTHWDAERAAAGELVMGVEVRFDTLINPSTDAILPRQLLDEAPFSGMHWDTQMSGVQIPDNIAAELEIVWNSFTGRNRLLLPEEVAENERIYEGAVRQITVNTYERSPEARRRCIDHYGSSCIICGFNFQTVYGEVGAGHIHVHHLRPLSEIGDTYEVDPIRDLRPVCPNCHAIIHRRQPPFSIEEVQNLLKHAG